MANIKDWVWTEKYRPQTIDDCILPQRLKDTFNGFVAARSIPNLILSGNAGVGKTTIARALARQMNAEVLIINASMHGNIDTLRNDIMQFASTISLEYDRKVVILDEADYLNPNSTQPALRNFMEQFHEVTFVLTCNYLNKIIEPLQSRTTEIPFRFSAKERAQMAGEMLGRVRTILKQEDITDVDFNAVAQLMISHFPDFRRVLNELQRYSVGHGKIDIGIIASGATSSATFDALIDAIKAKNFTKVRNWCGENPDTVNDAGLFYKTLYDLLKEAVTPDSIPSVIIAIAEYQYKHAFVVDKEINAAACLAVIMTEATFK